MEQITLENGDLEELLRLTKEAEQTPVIAMSVRDGMEGRDFASQAWGRVREKWDQLGEKYGFDPSEVKGIEPSSGNVLLSV